MPKVVIKDVAAHAGVSKATVSNFLNKPELVSAPSRLRIQTAIDDLGFVPNIGARQLRLADSRTIGYVAFEMGNVYFADVANAIERRAAAAGLHVLMGNNDGSVERERSYLELFEQQRVRGVIIAPIGDIEHTLDQMRQRGTPSVMTGRRAESLDQPSVSVEDVRGGYLAAKHLLESGKSRLAFVGGPLDIRQVSDRLQGAMQAVREVPGAQIEVVGVDERSVMEGRQVGYTLLDRDPARRPDAVFAVNDLVAIGIMQTILADGRLQIPEDMAFVGYDDIEFSESLTVPLTSIRTPHDDFGTAVVNLLLEEMGDDTTASGGIDRHLVFAPELVVRASSAGSAATAPSLAHTKAQA